MTTLTVSGSNVARSSNGDGNKAYRIAEGWHNTEKHGEVFVAHGGRAWVVQRSGQRLINVTVPLNPSDIIKTPLLERRKQAITKQSYRKRQDKRTQMANLPLSEAEGMSTGQDTSGMK